MKVVSVSYSTIEYVVVVFNVRMTVLYFYIIRAETRTRICTSMSYRFVSLAT